MNYSRLFALLVCTSLASVAVGQSAQDAEVLKRIEALSNEVNELRQSNDQLKSKVAKYEHGDGWLNSRRAEEIKSLVGEVLADADTRASLLADGAIAGHDGSHFFLASADGGFRLNIDGRIQFRYIYNNRDRTAAGGDSDEFGFEVRRTQLNFHGRINSGPTFLYDVGLQVATNDQGVSLDHAKIGHPLSDNLTIWFGEDKAWFLREEMTSPGKQLAVDRSLLNEAFTLGRIQGVWVVWEPDDMFRLYGSINDGLRSGEANGAGGFDCCGNDKNFDQDVVDVALTARIDVKLMGDWAQIKDFSAWSGEPTGVFVGAAVHWQLAETGDNQTAGDDLDFPDIGGEHDSYVSWTIDGSVECNGFNLFAAVVGTHTESVDKPGNAGVDHYGAMVQAGYMLIPDKVEPFVRLEWMTMEDQGALGDTPQDLTILTVGSNWYLKGHAAKLTLDVVYLFDPLVAENVDQHPVAVVKSQSLKGLGMLVDDANQDGQFIFRAQFQLLF